MQQLIWFGFGFFSGLAVLSGLFFVFWQMFKVQGQQVEQSKLAQDQQLKESFAALSKEALQQNTQSFLQVSQEMFKQQSSAHNQDLGNKKALIDQRLEQLNQNLLHLSKNVQQLEKDRASTFSNLQAQLKSNLDQTQQLNQTTQQLRAVLSHSKRRGQWGERMAEDVLRLTGLREGVNYHKQKATNSFDLAGRMIPDFTFILPNDVQVNMDVKFPLSNYLAYMDAHSDVEKNQKRLEFMKDVRLRMKEVVSKAYIHENTVDYVLIFIPNEQVYSFMNEQDMSLIDDALSKKVVFCSPLTLYAMLSIIDRASKDFIREKRAEDILKVLRQFQIQWHKFNEVLEKMGRRLEDSVKEFQILKTTRKNQLEKPLMALDDLMLEGPDSHQIIDHSQLPLK